MSARTELVKALKQELNQYKVAVKTVQEFVDIKLDAQDDASNEKATVKAMRKHIRDLEAAIDEMEQE